MTDQQYKAALDAIERAMVKEYLEVAAQTAALVPLAEMVAMIREGDAIGARDVFRSAKYGPLAEEIRAAYVAGATAEAADLSPAAARFLRTATGQRGVPAVDMQSPTARADVDRVTTNVIGTILEGQDGAVLTTIQGAAARDESAVRTAEQLLGVKGEYIAARRGGVAGLTEQDAQWVQNARDQLAAGDPAYFDRVRRDKRFDPIVKRAIAAGKGVAQADIDRIAARYADRLLTTRAESVASVAAMESYNAGRARLYQQMLDDGVPADAVQKTWQTRKDERVRASHRTMQGQTVRADQPFQTPRGALMMNPGDTKMGAPLSEVARCRCRATYTIKRA